MRMCTLGCVLEAVGCSAHGGDRMCKDEDVIPNVQMQCSPSCSCGLTRMTIRPLAT